MEDINKLWKEISEKAAPVPAESPVFMPTAQNVFEEMLRKVRYKLGFIYVFAAIYGGWMLWNWLSGGNPETTWLLLIMVVFTVWNLLLILPAYLRMKKHSAVKTGTIRETLAFYYDNLRLLIRYENRISAVFIPLAAMMGFSYAIIDTKGSVSYIFERPWLLITMIVTGVVIGALGILLAIWMNKVTFGKYLAYLKENLEGLER